MIVTLRDRTHLAAVKRALARLGQWIASEYDDGGDEVHLVLAAHGTTIEPARLAAIPGVARATSPTSKHPRVDAHGSAVVVGRVTFRPSGRLIIAGPCAIESEARIHALATALARAGVTVLRGGAYKPRTSPYAFHGHGADALRWLGDAARAAGLESVTEVLSERDVDEVAAVASMLQIGSRNMQNFALLRAVGAAERPVLLKRGASATIEEWLLAAEHLLVAGAPGVVLCERGVRGFDDSTRNLLDLGAVALLARAHGLPVVVDPSHATGRRELVVPLAMAAFAAGAAGVMIEVHDDPGEALSDGPQALSIDELEGLIHAP